MISLEYVNDSFTRDTDLFCKPFESFMESCKNDVDQMFAKFSMLEDRVTLESTIMGSAPEQMLVVYESEKKNIFTRIGELIINLYKKFMDFIDGVIDKIKTYSFKKKSDLQKLEILLKNHPDLKNEALIAFNNGALELSDVRSLKELDDAFDEIIKLSKKQNVDPNSLRGKWQKAKEKFDKDEKSWKIVKVAAATGTIISAFVAIKTLPAILAKHKNSAAEDREKFRKREAEALEIIKNDTDYANMGLHRLRLEITRELQERHTLVRKNNLSVIEHIQNAVTNFLDRFDKDKRGAKRLEADLMETKKRLDKADEKAQRAGLEKIKAETRIKAEVNKELNPGQSHREKMKEVRDTEYHRNMAREAFNRDHPKKTN